MFTKKDIPIILGFIVVIALLWAAPILIGIVLALYLILTYEPKKTKYGNLADYRAEFKYQPNTVYGEPLATFKTRKKDYMSSVKWDKLRKVVLKRDDYACRICGEDQAPLDVHHITYKNMGRESTEQLLTVCRSCHTDIHNTLGYNYEDTFEIIEYINKL